MLITTSIEKTFKQKDWSAF